MERGELIETREEARQRIKEEKTDAKAKCYCTECGKELSNIDRNAKRAYCEEHRHLAERDNQIIRDADPQLFVPLAAAVLKQEMDRYRRLLVKQYQAPLDAPSHLVTPSRENLHALQNAEDWILSKNYAILDMGVTEPKQVMRLIRKAVAIDMGNMEGKMEFAQRMAKDIKKCEKRILDLTTERSVLKAECFTLANEIEELRALVREKTKEYSEKQSRFEDDKKQIKELKYLGNLLKQGMNARRWSPKELEEFGAFLIDMERNKGVYEDEGYEDYEEAEGTGES